MDPGEAAAALWWIIGMVPAGIVAHRRRRGDGWDHVLSRALAWPLYLLMGRLTRTDPWAGAP